MKQFIINLGFVYLGGFVFYVAVVLWFNRPNLRKQLAVLHNLNDGNVAYSNGLNATIRDLRNDAVEFQNVISIYDDAAGDSRRKIEDLEKELVDYMNRDIANKSALLRLESKYDNLVRVNQADFDTIAKMRSNLADAHRETSKFRKQAEHHEITIKEYNKLLNEARDAVNESQVEIRNAKEALEFLKSELVMAERQLERLS